MGVISIQPGTLTNYRYETMLSDSTVYLGTGGYRIRLKLELPRSIRSLSGTVRFRVNSGYSLGTGDFAAAMTREEGNVPPSEVEDFFRFTWDANRGGTFGIRKRMQKGKWYLWLWSTFGDHQEVLSGEAGSGYPLWALSAETANGGRICRNGVWNELTPKLFTDGTWKELSAREYKGSWGELG